MLSRIVQSFEHFIRKQLTYLAREQATAQREQRQSARFTILAMGHYSPSNATPDMELTHQRLCVASGSAEIKRGQEVTIEVTANETFIADAWWLSGPSDAFIRGMQSGADFILPANARFPFESIPFRRIVPDVLRFQPPIHVAVRVEWPR